MRLMAEDKILSICIPTYNRAKVIDRLFQNISKEIDGVAEAVEVCVSDNASTDETQSLLNKWKKMLPLRYNINNSNLGYDINVLKAIELAQGKFIWLMGDDDLIVQGSLKRLIKNLEMNSDKDLGAVYLNLLVRKRWVDCFGFNDFKVFESEGKRVPISLGFIGSVCVNTAKVKRIIKEKIRMLDGKLIKTDFHKAILEEFIHAFLFLETAKNSAFYAISPRDGLILIGDVQSYSYKKKFIWEVSTLRYSLELQKYYPEFKPAVSLRRELGCYLSLSAIALENDSFGNIFGLYSKAFIRYLEKRGSRTEALLVGFFGQVINMPIAKNGIIILHKYVRKKIGAQINDNNERDPEIERGAKIRDLEDI